MLIMGIDPGVNASAALYAHGPGGNLPSGFVDMVDIEMVPDGETRRQLDGQWFGDLLERWTPDVAVIENVQVAVMPPKVPGGRRVSVMSPSDAFRFGLSCGEVRGFVKAYQIAVEMVHPRTWTAHFGLKGGAKEKKNHIAKLLELQPSARRWITLQRHHGKGDAGLLALWYAETHGFLQ